MAKQVSASMKTKKTITNVIVHVGLSIMALIWIMPIVWVFLNSIRVKKGSYIIPSEIIPSQVTFNNYVRLFSKNTTMPFGRWFINTLVIAIFSCIISTFFVLSVSYCMSRLRFKLRKTFLNIALVLGMFPGFMSMIAVYYILKGIGMTQGNLKIAALIIVYSAGSGLGFYIAKGFFDTIPKAIDEAAYIDGATKWNVFTMITMPLSKPIVVYTVLTSFMAPWIDFIFAKVIMGTDVKLYTVSIGLWQMLEKEMIYEWYSRYAAGAVCVSIPIAILFMFMQKYYVDGLSGSVKG